jgi:hypothetical protein
MKKSKSPSEVTMRQTSTDESARVEKIRALFDQIMAESGHGREQLTTEQFLANLHDATECAEGCELLSPGNDLSLRFSPMG